MARPKIDTDETASEELSVGDELRLLLKQQTDLGERIRLLAERAETEIKTLKVEVQERGAALGEARAELAEVRAALETETVKRTAAEARIRKLEAKIEKIRATVDEEDDAEPDEVLPAAPIELDAEIVPAATPPTSADTFGLSPIEIDMVDALVARGEAPDRTAMLRVLVLRALAAEGVSPGGAAVPADREKAQASPG